MKKGLATKKLITSIMVTVTLLYFMAKSPSPKIIFIPFLVCSISLAGKNIALLVLGFKDSNMGLVFGGVIFTFGSLAFVLAALTMKGYFDKIKIDVLGLYAGAVIAVIGMGFILLMCKEPVSSYGL